MPGSPDGEPHRPAGRRAKHSVQLPTRPAGRQLGLDLDRAALPVHDAHRAECLEELEHPAILGQQQGREANDALGPRSLGEEVEQRSPDAAALPVIDHRDGGLGRVRAVAATHEACHADAVARLGVDRGERFVVVVVDVREVGDEVAAEPRHRCEEAPVARLGPETLESSQQQGAIVWMHGAHDHAGAIA